MISSSQSTYFQYESLRRVHLIPEEDTPAEAANTVNANVFRDLDSKVSEAGENFSTGYEVDRNHLKSKADTIVKRETTTMYGSSDFKAI